MKLVNRAAWRVAGANALVPANTRRPLCDLKTPRVFAEITDDPAAGFEHLDLHTAIKSSIFTGGMGTGENGESAESRLALLAEEIKQKRAKQPSRVYLLLTCEAEVENFKISSPREMSKYAVAFDENDRSISDDLFSASIDAVLTMVVSSLKGGADKAIERVSDSTYLLDENEKVTYLLRVQFGSLEMRTSSPLPIEASMG